MAEKDKSARGFAAMDAEKQRQIASQGGRAAHEKGTAHEFTPDEARAAGRKGGEAVSKNRQHMAEIGRQGGLARGSRRRREQSAGGQDGEERHESERTWSEQGTADDSRTEHEAGHSSEGALSGAGSREPASQRQESRGYKPIH